MSDVPDVALIGWRRKEAQIMVTMQCPGCGHKKETPAGGSGWRCPKCDRELRREKPVPAKA